VKSSLILGRERTETMSTGIAIEEARAVLRLYYSDLPPNVILAAYFLQESGVVFTSIREGEDRLVAAKNAICKARAHQDQKACHLPE